MDTLYLVMPAYNEADNIRKVIADWYPVLANGSQDSRLVIADSGSTDATHAILQELKQGEYPQLEILEDTIKYHGPKVIALYEYAIKQGADYIFQTDSDGQTNPEEFADFWKDREQYDAIFGNRTVRGDGQSRAFVEGVVCFLLKLYFGIKVPDANAPFRLMKAATVDKYIHNLPEDYELPNVMMVAYMKKFKERVDFREITFKPRLAGENSINVPSIIKHGWKALGDFARQKKFMK